MITLSLLAEKKRHGLSRDQYPLFIDVLIGLTAINFTFLNCYHFVRVAICTVDAVPYY